MSDLDGYRTEHLERAHERALRLAEQPGGEIEFLGGVDAFVFTFGRARSARNEGVRALRRST